ncbi:sensor histidine kinase [Dethiobacter alkaliphilus]|uniref:sensor histidine kinase n=1 Tax=Dethiobacter alkaliphilus TaxID=427926 RepID=UPI00222648E1|nr:ATP-binding protein [Dethiobacter alkaliphilus]MCW3489503.1 ATP-binding protein [Dethiobacter alkaliphilus]
MKKKYISLKNSVQQLKKKIAYKYFFAIFIVTLIPIIFLGVYFISEATFKIRNVIQDSKEQLIENNLDLQKESLINHANWINLHFTNIEGNVQSLKSFAEYMFNNREHFNAPNNNPVIKQHEKGYYYSNVVEKESNLFVSSRTSLTDELLRDIYLTAHMDPVMQRFDMNEDIVASYLLFSESVTRIYPAINFTEFVEMGLFPSDLNVDEHSFYSLAADDENVEGNVVMTDIYQDITDRGYMVSWTAPVYLDDGTLRGVVGVDMTVENILSSVLDITFKHKGSYAFLVTHNGQIIFPPDMLLDDLGIVGSQEEINIDSVPSSPFREAIILTNNDSDKTKLVLNDQEKYLLSTKIPVNDWTLAYVVPNEEIVQPLELAANQQIVSTGEEIVIQVLIATLLSLIIAGIIAKKMAQTIATPVLDLTEGVKQVASGKLQKSINVQSYDELGTLTHYFNKMADRIQQLIADLKEKADAESKLSAELVGLNQNLEIEVIERTKELRKSNVELKKALENLEMLQESRAVLFSNISHELKTPLTMLAGYVEALGDDLPSDEQEFKQYLSVVRKQTERLNRLINDLIDLSQIESRQAINFLEIDTNEFFLQYFDELSLFLEKKRVAFTYQIPPNLPSLIGDAGRLIQVFNNLVHNAIRYIDENGHIYIEVVRLDDRLVVKVRDNGCGISEEDMKYIFERFYKGRERNGRTGGTSGLGLPIAKEIVKIHGGELNVDSIPGKGTTFRISLPILIK